MKAAILTAHNESLEVEDVECGPVQFGQVRVKVLASGICGAQLQEIRGEKGGPLPHLLGHEGCGIVEEIGPGVTRVKAGDKVVLHWRKAAGIESDFPRYKFRGEWITSGKVTTFSEQALVSENRVTPVPEDTSVEFATLLGCSYSTALATLEQEGSIRFGRKVLVIGCGGLGLSLLHNVSLISPGHVCACDVHENKRDAVRSISDRFVNMRREKLEGAYDLIYDTAGAPEAMEKALPLLAPSGRYVMIGQPPPGASVKLANARHFFDGEGKELRATQGGGFRPDVDIPRYIAAAKSNEWTLYGIERGIITHRFPLESINAAIETVREGEAGRVLVEMNKT